MDDYFSKYNIPFTSSNVQSLENKTNTYEIPQEQKPRSDSDDALSEVITSESEEEKSEQRHVKVKDKNLRPPTYTSSESSEEDERVKNKRLRKRKKEKIQSERIENNIPKNIIQTPLSSNVCSKCKCNDSVSNNSNKEIPNNNHLVHNVNNDSPATSQDSKIPIDNKSMNNIDKEEYIKRVRSKWINY